MKNWSFFILITLLTSRCVQAQTDTVRLEPLEISSSRTPMLLHSSIRPMGLLSHVQIQSLPGSDLPQLLSYAIGFDIRHRGPADIQADISVRGASFDQTLVLLNGLCMNDPQTGHHNMNLPVDMAHIDRIEFISGPGTRLYGTNAFAGAVNFITEVPDKAGLKISLAAGDFGLFTGYLSGSFRTGKLRHFFGAGARTCEGYTTNTDFTENKLYYHGLLPLKTGSVQLMAGLLNKAFGANSFYSAKYPNQFERIQSEFVALKLSTGRNVRLQPSLYWKRHADHFELFREDAPAWYTTHNNHRTDILGADLNLSFRSVIGTTSLGINLRYDHIHSNVLGELTGHSLPVPGDPDAQFTRAGERCLLSLFVDQQFQFRRFKLSAGALLHYTADFGAGVYPGLECAYTLSRSVQLYASLNRALRLPTFTDLYYQGPVNTGNPDLLPEESWDTESGLKYEGKGIEGRFCGFFRLGEHLIDWVKYPGDTKWRSANLTRLNTYGIEGQVRLNFPALLKKNFFLTEASLSYQWIDMKKPTTDFISYYVLDFLKHKVVLSMQHGILKNLSGAWTLSYRDRAGSYSDLSSGLEKDYTPYLLLDGKIRWDLGPIDFWIGVNNITNTRYRDISSVLMPGRWVSGGLQIELQ